VASFYERFEMFKVLVQRKGIGELSTLEAAGMDATLSPTPLYEAAKRDLPEMVCHLLECPDVEIDAAEPSGGTTALMAACLNGNAEIVEMLLNSHKGADISKVQTRLGKTAFNMVFLAGRTEIVQLFIDSGRSLDEEYQQLLYVDLCPEGPYWSYYQVGNGRPRKFLDRKLSDLLLLLDNHLDEEADKMETQIEEQRQLKRSKLDKKQRKLKKSRKPPAPTQVEQSASSSSGKKKNKKWPRQRSG